eukprot:TRINITY_DN74943_c0_g1_i1.p1 TRINITY_DN74943_c0_g1~~TRINITY_DN74943_c0_g1_i1.p1  ORF type:complete len:256 (-),score=18.04 TRINITY_DN74943_c0_g1_i1:78-845(-)
MPTQLHPFRIPPSSCAANVTSKSKHQDNGKSLNPMAATCPIGLQDSVFCCLLYPMLQSITTKPMQRREELKRKQCEWQESSFLCDYINTRQDEDIERIDVGGTLHSTFLSTLTCVSNTFLSAMFSGAFGDTPHEHEDDATFIDRDCDTFSNVILPFLRFKSSYGTCDVEATDIEFFEQNILCAISDNVEIEQVVTETSFFGLDRIAEICAQKSRTKKTTSGPVKCNEVYFVGDQVHIEVFRAPIQADIISCGSMM